MRINATTNVQNKNWSTEKYHIERKFEARQKSKNNKTGYDSNLGINRNLSKFNQSSDGKIIEDKNGNHHFIPDRRGYNHGEAIKNKMIKDNTKDYIIHHNQMKSVRKNPKSRKINSPFDLFNKNDQRTCVNNFGDAPTNYHNIKLIQSRYKRGYHEAYIRYIKAVGQGLVNASKSFNQRHKCLRLLHYCTNVDETTGVTKPNDRPDAIHSHYNIIGFSWTRYNKDGNPVKSRTEVNDKGKFHRIRGAKPSFSVGRAMCHEYHIPYSKRGVRKAEQQFDLTERRATIKNVRAELAKRFEKVPEFQGIKFTPKHSKINNIPNKLLKKMYARADEHAKKIARHNEYEAHRIRVERRHLQKIRSNRKRNRQRAKRVNQRKYRNSLKASLYASSASNEAHKAQSLSNTTKNLSNKLSASFSASSSASVAVDKANKAVDKLNKQARSYSSANTDYQHSLSSLKPKVSSANTLYSSANSKIATILSQYAPMTHNKRKMSKKRYQSVANNGVYLTNKKKSFTASELINDKINNISTSASRASSAVSSANRTISNAEIDKNNLIQAKSRFRKDQHIFDVFMAQQLQLLTGMKTTSEAMSYVTGTRPYFIDGMNRRGLDLITKVASKDLMNRQHQAQVTTVKTNLADYQKNSQPKEPNNYWKIVNARARKRNRYNNLHPSDDEF